MNMAFSLTQRNTLGLVTLLAIVIGIFYAYAIYQWHADWVITHQGNNAATVASDNQTAKMIAAIPTAHLFGKSFAGSGNAPVSSLQFKVTGIVKVDDGKSGSASRAYISTDNQPAKIFEVGDSLPYGVKIHEISSSAVIIENDGHLEKLVLPREKLVFKPQSEGGM